jgi:hypothetical protein
MSTIVFDKCPKCDLKPLRRGLAVCPRCKFNVAAHAEKLSRGPVSPDQVTGPAPFDMAAYLASMQPGADPNLPPGPTPMPAQINQVTPSDVADLVMQVNTGVFHMSSKLDVVVQGLAQLSAALAQVVMALHPPAAAAQSPTLASVPPTT